MNDIFLARAAADAPRANALAEALRGGGYDVTTGARAPAGDGASLAKLSLILWSRAAVDGTTGGDVQDEADEANGRGGYLGVLIDQVALPFGFGGSTPVDIAPYREGDRTKAATVVAAVRGFMANGQAPVRALPPPAAMAAGRSRAGGLAALLALAAVLAGGIVWLLIRGDAPTTGELIEARLGQTPCAWLRVDPLRDGSNGRLGLTGVAGDPAKAGAAVLEIARAGRMAVDQVATDRVARIDPRECAAIDEPRRLRKSPGGRLIVTGEPFVLDTALKPAQALARVELTLAPADRTVALFGVEPSGVVTWAIPDKAMLEGLKGADVGFVSTAPGRYEFSIYPDHLGWTGLFVVVGDAPLAVTKPQGTVQGARDFATTLRAATAKGGWDADMIWFRIDPK